ncbi:DNA cytosine methyltransferase [Alcanivorax sp.]|jgi:DNA (cytosine-5)-methyltransferase 1|uniref:DNA cytosine methyltransferase n=1 Tax=Alcanivorax sp. TaxID=1872427 RepID=UPI0032D8F5FC
MRPKAKDQRHTTLKKLATELSKQAKTDHNTQCLRDAFDIHKKNICLNIHEAWPRALQNKPGPISVFDMFSGCGGMSAGFKLLNSIAPIIDLKGAVDIDTKANETYEENHQLKVVDADVAKLSRSSKKLESIFNHHEFSNDKIRILIGCAPCQGFSSHRNSDGEKDLRNTLFMDFAKIAVKTQPEVIVIENVPEILTERYWPHVQKARKILEESGYYVHVGAHNMAEFGVPQERFRALILAMKKPFHAPKGFLAPQEFATVRSSISDLPPVEAGEKCSSDPFHYSAKHKESTLATIRAVPHDGGNRPDNVGPASLRNIKSTTGKAAYEDVYGRLPWDKPSITITAFARNPASGRFTHPEQDRALTIREASLLQGFPKQYQFSGSLDSSFRQIGNAVPPIFSAAIASHIVSELLSPPIAEENFDRGILGAVGASFSRAIPSIKARSRATKN